MYVWNEWRHLMPLSCSDPSVAETSSALVTEPKLPGPAGPYGLFSDLSGPFSVPSPGPCCCLIQGTRSLCSILPGQVFLSLSKHPFPADPTFSPGQVMPHPLGGRFRDPVMPRKRLPNFISWFVQLLFVGLSLCQMNLRNGSYNQS